jgi:hypothetical protein
MNERPTIRFSNQRIDDVPGYLARYAAEVDAWAADASARRA